MSTRHLLYAKEYPVNDFIKVVIPTVGEILEHEDDYYSAVSLLTAMPIDMMVQLEDMGIDFASINEYELFLIFFGLLQGMDTSLIFGDLDLKDFKPTVNEQNGMVILSNEKTGVRIDRAIHGQIAAVLRKIHHLERNNRKPGNAEARRYMLERARSKTKRHKNRENDSQLEREIIALVNTSDFPYDYTSVRNVSIYQFNTSLLRVVRTINYDNTMHGVYAGTVNAKHLSQDELSWLPQK